MMFTKSTVLVTLFAAVQVAVATPPACLLAAVNTQPNPSDLAAVCKASEVTSSLKSACGGDYATAMTAFKDVCKGAGVTVAEPSVSHSRPRPTKIASSKKPAPTTSQKTGGASHPPPRPTKVSSMTTKATAKPTVTKSTGGGSAPTSTGGSSGASSTGGAGSGPTKSGSSGPAPSNAAGHLEAGAYLAMLAAGLVAAL